MNQNIWLIFDAFSDGRQKQNLGWKCASKEK
jgi:hypothetical protein